MLWVLGAMGLSLLQLVKSDLWGGCRGVGLWQERWLQKRLCVLESLPTFWKPPRWACYPLFSWGCSPRRGDTGCRHDMCTSGLPLRVRGRCRWSSWALSGFLAPSLTQVFLQCQDSGSRCPHGKLNIWDLCLFASVVGILTIVFCFSLVVRSTALWTATPCLCTSCIPSGTR